MKIRPLCPVYVQRMTIKKPQNSSSIWDAFWACVRYPTCRGTREIIEKQTQELYDIDNDEY